MCGAFQDDGANKQSSVVNGFAGGSGGALALSVQPAPRQYMEPAPPDPTAADLERKEHRYLANASHMIDDNQIEDQQQRGPMKISAPAVVALVLVSCVLPCLILVGCASHTKDDPDESKD